MEKKRFEDIAKFVGATFVIVCVMSGLCLQAAEGVKCWSDTPPYTDAIPMYTKTQDTALGGYNVFNADPYCVAGQGAICMHFDSYSGVAGAAEAYGKAGADIGKVTVSEDGYYDVTVRWRLNWWAYCNAGALTGGLAEASVLIKTNVIDATSGWKAYANPPTWVVFNDGSTSIVHQQNTGNDQIVVCTMNDVYLERGRMYYVSSYVETTTVAQSVLGYGLAHAGVDIADTGSDGLGGWIQEVYVER